MSSSSHNGSNGTSNNNNSNNNNNNNTDIPKRQVLAELPRGAVTFLTTIATSSTIRNALIGVGYTPAVHERGWELLFKATAWKQSGTNGGSTSADAMKELEHWQATTLARARTTLRHNHPAQADYVFAELTLGKGHEAITTVAIFLARCNELQNSPSRKATRKADHAALETLAERGIGVAERKRVQALVDKVSSSSIIVADAPPENVSKRMDDFIALYHWLEEWRDTARIVLTRRTDLISLGIARRRTRKPDAPPTVIDPPAGTGTPPPVVVAPQPAPPTTPLLPPGPIAQGAPPAVVAPTVGNTNVVTSKNTNSKSKNMNDATEEAAPPSRAA